MGIRTRPEISCREEKSKDQKTMSHVAMITRLPQVRDPQIKFRKSASAIEVGEPWRMIFSTAMIHITAKELCTNNVHTMSGA